MDEWTFVVCESGYYGKDCRHQSSINCYVPTHCNKFTGQCEGGCKPGWTGSTCNQGMNIWLLYLKRRRNFMFYIQLKLLLKSCFFSHFYGKLRFYSTFLTYYWTILSSNNINSQFKHILQYSIPLKSQVIVLK